MHRVLPSQPPAGGQFSLEAVLGKLVFHVLWDHWRSLGKATALLFGSQREVMPLSPLWWVYSNTGLKPAQLYDSHLQLPKKKLIQYCSDTKEKQFFNIINNCFKEAFTPRDASEESMYGLAPCITLCYSLQRLNRCPESLPLEKQLNMRKALKNYVASFHQDSLAENTEEIACWDCLQFSGGKLGFHD